MKQSALLEFESSAFAVERDEDEHTNPGVFGKALASWLADELRARGLRAGEVIAEDFGWCVPIESKPHRLFVACGSANDAPNQWQAFTFAEGGLVSRLFGKDTSAQGVAALFGTLKQVLQAAAHVRHLREEAA